MLPNNRKVLSICVLSDSATCLNYVSLNRDWWDGRFQRKRRTSSSLKMLSTRKSNWKSNFDSLLDLESVSNTYEPFSPRTESRIDEIVIRHANGKEVCYSRVQIKRQFCGRSRYYNWMWSKTRTIVHENFIFRERSTRLQVKMKRLKFRDSPRKCILRLL